jgi:hypothetical protein
MLVEAVDHLAQAEAYVLEADLLAHDVERHRRESAVHLAHHPREHRAIAHARVEKAHRRWARMDMRELEPHAARHHVFLAARIDEEEVLLAVVEKAEVLFRRRLARCCNHGLHSAGANEGQQFRRRIARARRAVLHHELVDPGESLGRDARAVAQPRDELAVVHRAPAEGRLRHAGAPAEFGDASQEAAAGRDFHAASVGKSPVG